jgi:putative SOS response-associated peptidase YedK
VCGRYTITPDITQLVERFKATVEEHATHEARYNVAPTTQVPVVAMREGRRMLRTRRWGLIPHWAKDPSIGSRLINARAETVAKSAAFRDAVRADHRRCLIPADGFYEWLREGKERKPFHFRLPDGGLFAFAGLTASWSSKEDPDDVRKTCTILTTGANAETSPIHDRMPLILLPDEEEIWLGTDTDAALALTMRPEPDGLLIPRPVSQLVNSVRNQGPEVLADAAAS